MEKHGYGCLCRDLSVLSSEIFVFFYSYVLIGSRFGQLLMTLAPPTAAICGALILHESLHLLAIVGMVVTLCGIAISVISRGEKSGERMHIKLPLKGLWMGIGGGVGQVSD